MLRISFIVGALFFLLSEIMRFAAHEFDSANAGMQLFGALLMSVGALGLAFGANRGRLQRYAAIGLVVCFFLLAFFSFDLLGYGRTSLFLHQANMLFWASHMGLAGAALLFGLGQYQTQNCADDKKAILPMILFAAATLVFAVSRLGQLPLRWQFCAALLWTLSLLILAVRELKEG